MAFAISQWLEVEAFRMWKMGGGELFHRRLQCNACHTFISQLWNTTGQHDVYEKVNRTDVAHCVGYSNNNQKVAAETDCPEHSNA